MIVGWRVGGMHVSANGFCVCAHVCVRERECLRTHARACARARVRVCVYVYVYVYENM